ncbi:MAG: 50S ribosomal protein L4 [Candidatus Levybacteria bacterium]|nr:50S ribosomal protein L4 [Candidatus Levybacteria bacterium]
MPAKKITATIKKTSPAKVKKNEAAATVAAKKETGITANVLDVQGKVVGKVTLPSSIFGSKVNNILIAQAVRVYLANQRRGTASTKSRGEVDLTTAKWYRQKGTGRARHGAKSAPIFVKGGVAFGPKPHDFSLKMPQKMKQRALFSSLSGKLQEGNVRIVAGLGQIPPKTKEVVAMLKSLALDDRKNSVLLITGQERENIVRAGKNIEAVTIIPAAQLNTYEVLRSKTVIFMKESVDEMKKHFLKE